MFKNFLKIAFRNLLKHKTYSLINIGSLTIGMTVCVVVFLYAKFEFSFDKFHKDHQNIYRIIRTSQVEQWADTKISLESEIAPWLKSDFHEIKNVCRTTTSKGHINYNNESYNVNNLLAADPSVFEIFTFSVLKGNPENALKNPDTIILTESLAKTVFGDEEPLGKLLKINNNYLYTVAGVVQDYPENSHLKVDAIVSNHDNRFCFSITSSNENSSVTWNLYNVYIDADINSTSEFEQKINQGYLSQFQSIDEVWKTKSNTPLKLQSLKDIYFNPVFLTHGFRFGNKNQVYLFIAIAFITLIIAGINYVNLTTARSLVRTKEFGIKKTIGAIRGQLIFQILTESLLLSIIPFFFALILTELVTQIFATILSINFFPGLFQSVVDSFAIIISIVLIGVFAGLYPALYLSKFHPIDTIKERVFSNHKGKITRKVLIIFQFSISIALIIATIFIYKQHKFFVEKKLGYNPELLVHLEILDYSKRTMGELLKEKLLQNPNVSNVCLSKGVPGNQIKVGDARGIRMSNINTTPDFIETFDMKIIKGRNFLPGDKGKAKLLNEAAVKYLEFDQPIGKKLWNNEIVGVVKDFHFKSLHNEIEPLCISYRTSYLPDISVKISSKDIHGTVNYMKKVWGELLPGAPFNYYFYDDWLNAQYRAEERLRNLIAYISMITILISCTGLIGLALFTAERRTKEIGIRKVLGASVTGIVHLLSREILMSVALANVIAWPIAYFAMNKWLQNFAYRIDLTIWPFLLAGLSSLLIAMITISWHTVHAATANPVESLRYE